MTLPVEKLLEARTANGRSPQPVPLKRVIFIPVPSVSVPIVVHWALLLFVFTLPFEGVNQFLQSSPLTLIKMSGFLFFSTCLLYPKRCFAHPPRVLWWFVGYIIIFTMNCWFIPEKFVSGLFSSLFTRIQLIFLFWTASCLLQEEKLARSVLLTFAMATVLLTLGTIFHAPGFVEATGQMGARTRVTAFGDNPNTVSLLTACAAVILLGLLLDKTVRSSWSKAFLVAPILPLFLVTIRSGSRAGIGALLIGVSLYLLPYRGAKHKMVKMLWGVLTIVCVVYMVISNPISSKRWEQAYEGDTAGRDKIYGTAIDMIVERPVFGWQPVIALYELGGRLYNIEISRSAHSLFLHLLIEGGIVGATPFLVALWLCARAAWKARTGGLGMLPLALLMTLLAYGITHTNLTDKPTWLILSLAAAAPSFMVRGYKGRLRIPLGGNSFPARLLASPYVHKRT